MGAKSGLQDYAKMENIFLSFFFIINGFKRCLVAHSIIIKGYQRITKFIKTNNVELIQIKIKLFIFQKNFVFNLF